MKLLTEIYKTMIHIVVDLRSTRERILWSTLAIFILTLIYSQQNAIICGLVSGWVTIVITFYFVSKHNQANNQHQIIMKNAECNKSDLPE